MEPKNRIRSSSWGKHSSHQSKDEKNQATKMRRRSYSDGNRRSCSGKDLKINENSSKMKNNEKRLNIDDYSKNKIKGNDKKYKAGETSGKSVRFVKKHDELVSIF